MALPVTRLLVDLLAAECDAALKAIAESVEEGEVEIARVTTGKLRACEALLAAFHPPERPISTPEEEFQDPAAIKGRA